jgi:hypothetical protein
MRHQAVFCADTIYPLFMNLSYIENHDVVMMIWWGGKWSWIILKHYSGRGKIFPVLWSTRPFLEVFLQIWLPIPNRSPISLKSCQNDTWSVENLLSSPVSNPWMNDAVENIWLFWRMRNGTQTWDAKCVRCYVPYFVEEASYKNPWANQIGICLRGLTEPILPSLCHAHALVNLQFSRCAMNTRWAQQQIDFCFWKLMADRARNDV